MVSFYKLRLVGIFLVVLLSSIQLFGQATIVNNGNFPRYETLDQRTIQVRFNKAGLPVTLTGTTAVGDWVVKINGVTVTTTGLAIVGTDVFVRFQPSDVHGGTNNFMLPGETLTFQFTNPGTLTESATPVNSSGGFITAVNKWVADCTDVAFLSIGLITLPVAKSTAVCSPVVEDFTQFQYYLSVRVRNSASYPTGNFIHQIAWGDGNTTNEVSYLSDLNGVANPAFYDASGAGFPAVITTTRPVHNYPSTLPGTGGDCSWNAKATPVLNFAAFTACTGFSKTSIFATYDTDNKNTGLLNLPPSPLATSNQVCRGTNVGMQFSDNTNLNCRRAVEVDVPNERARAIRFTYGSRDNGGVGNIPDVRVTLPVANYGSGKTFQVTNNDATGTRINYGIAGGGYYPINDNASDGNGVITLAAPVTISTLLDFSSFITTVDPTKQVVGQRFYIKMEYWDVCNPYDPLVPATLANAESIENYVEIIAKPVPLTSAGLALCYTSPNSTAFNFTAVSSIGGARTGVNWYKDFASVATATKMANGVNNLSFAAGSYGAQGGIGGNFTSNNANGRYHSVWATQVAAGSNNCESDPIEIVIVQQPRIDIAPDLPLTPSGNTSVCNGPPGVNEVYTTSAPNIKTIPVTTSTNASAVNLPTENTWSVSGFAATVSLTPSTGNSTTVTYNISPQPTPLDNGNVSVRRGYVTTTNIAVVSPVPSPFTVPTYNINPLACLNSNVNLSVDVYGQSNGGTISPSPTICAGVSTGNMNATGTLGAILQWERSYNAGVFTTIAGTVGLTTFSEIPPNGAGTYKYRVLVQNQNALGPCAAVTTVVANQNTVTVNPTPPQPTISQTGASTGLTICSDGVQRTILQSSDVGTLAASYQWFKNGSAVVGATSATITLTTVAQSGNYTVQVIGVAPSNCPSLVSNPTLVTINPLPTAANPTGGGAVCSGNPAPDIVWSGLTGTAPFSITYTITKNPGAIVSTIGPTAEPTTTFTIASPNPVGSGGDTFDYKITNLVDANGCIATPASLSALSSRQVSIGGTAPVLDAPFTLTPDNTCDNGGSTTDPVLNFSLDGPSTTVGPSYTVTYKVNGGSNLTKSFTVNASGDPSSITFSEIALNAVATHTITVVSILTPSGCLSNFGTPLSFTVNPLPANPTGAVNGFVCSTSPTGALLTVNDPGAGFLIEWYTTAAAVTLATGTISGSNNQSFTPTSNATATYFALSRNTTTACRSASTLAVTNTLDTAPAAAAAGAAQPLICASTTTVTLAASAANNGGIGAWSISGQVTYNQNFSNFINGTSSSTALNGWTRNVSGANVFNGGVGTFDIQTNRFVATNTNGSLGGGAGNIGEVVWNSAIIDISSIGPATATVDLINVTNNLAAPEDYIKAFYKLNGGAEIAFTTNGSLIGNFANSTAQTTGLSGATLQIVIRASVDAAANSVAFDNVVVRSATAGSISFSDPNSPTSTVTGLPAPAPGAAAITTTLTWTVSSALGVCANTTSNVAITINPLPKAIDTTPKLCETLPGGNQTTGVDLTSFNAAVTDAPTVAWFTDAARTIPVGTPTSHTVLGASPILYFRATFSLTTNCVNTGQLTFTVNSQPAAANQSGASTQFCEDVIGGNQKAGIDLTSNFNTAITGGAANRTVAWFSDAGLTIPVATPTSYTLVGPSQTLFAQVTNTITGCTRTATVSLSIKPRPVNNPISGNASVCTGSNIILYQLDPSLNPGSTYSWTIVGTPPAAVQVFGGGGTNTSNFFALLKFPAATGTVQIDVFETLNGCTGNTKSLLVNVNTAPAANTITGISQVCSNQTGVQYKVTTPNAATYTWTVTGATVASAANDKINIDFSTISPVSITVSETSTLSGCVGPPANLSVTVNPRPVMTSSNANTVCSGNAPTLNFAASLASTFNWTVTSITGAIGGTLVGDTGSGNINQVLVNNSGVVGSVTYSVTPTVIAAPNCDGASQAVTITVNPAPVLVNPQTKTICSGSQVNYEIVTSPLNLPSGTSFTWAAPTMSAGAAQGTSGTNIPAGAAGTLHITDILNNTTNASITATYTITPTSGSGCIGTPRDVVITISPQPSVATTLDNARCSGANIGLTLATAPGSPIAVNYNITSRSVPGGLTPGSSNAIVPATGVSNNYLSNDNFKNLGTSILNVTYTVVPVSSFGCLGSPKIITIQILPEPSLSSSLDGTVCSNTAISLNLTTAVGSIAATSYNIVGITIAAGLIPSGTNAVVPFSSVASNYLVNDKFTNTTNANLTVIYQVVPVGAGSCAGDPPKSITITIQPEPVISVSLNATVCSRSAISLTLNTQATSVAALNYDIVSRTIDPGLIAAGTNASVPAAGVPSGYLLSDKFTNIGNAQLTVTYRVVATSAAGCTGGFRDIVISINPEPVMSNALDITRCSDLATGLTLNTNGVSVAASSYNIAARSISGGLVPNIANAAVPASGVVAGYLANDIFTNTGASSLSVIYTVVPVSASGCLGASKVITLTVDPEPVMATNLDGAVCSNVIIGLTLNTNGSSIIAATYNITNRTIAPGLTANAGNVTVPASGVGAGYLTNDIFANSGNSALTVTYTVVPVSAGGCEGNSRVITLTVNPESVMSNTLDATVCSAATIGLTLNTNGTSVAAANYNIVSKVVAGGLVAAGTNAVVPATGVAANYLANDKYTNNGSSVLTVVYNVVPVSATGCPGISKAITITINPEPVLSTTLDKTVCSDIATALTLNTNGSSVAAATYNITARSVAGGLVPGGSNVSVPASGVTAAYLSNDVFTNIGSGSLNVTYTIVPISAAGCLGASRVVTVTINPEPVISTLLNTTTCSNVAIGLTLNTNGSSVAAANYNVTSLTVAGGLIANPANATVPALGVSISYLNGDKYTNTGASSLTVSYTVVPVSVAGCSGNAQVITITVNPEPVVSTLLNSTNCSDAIINLTLNTNGSSISAGSYNITNRVIGSGLLASGSNVAVPSTGVTASYLLNDKFNNITGAAAIVTYTIVPVASGGCLGDPKDVVITISPEPVLSSTLNKTVCSDLATSLVLNTNGSSVAALNYNITSVTIAGGLVAAGTNAVIPASGVNANFIANDKFTNTGSIALTVVYRIVPISSASCLGDPVDVTVTINPEPVLSTTLDGSVCSGLITVLNLNTNGTSVSASSYNITASTVAGGLVAAGTNAVVPTTGVAANYLNGDKFINTGALPLAVTYTIIPVSGATCVGKSRVVTITINPEPVVSSSLNAAICSDLAIGLTLATNGSSVAAANYNITTRVIGGGLVAAGTNVAVPANNVLTNYLANDKFTNNGTSSSTVTYTVVPISGIGCVGQPVIVTMTINPEPVIASGLDKTVCSDAAVALTLNTIGTSVAAASYNFTSRVVAGGLISAGANVAVPASGVAASYVAGDVFTNTGTSSLAVTYTIVSVSSAGCLGDPKVIVVTVDPEPVVSNSLDKTLCSGIATGLLLNTNGTSVAAQNYNITARTIAPGLTPNGSNAGVPAVGVAGSYLNGDIFTNTGSASLNVTYTVVPKSASSCLGDPKVITITIDPQPVVSTTLNTNVCSDLPIGLTLNTNGTSVSAATYDITTRVMASGLTAAVTNASVPTNGVLANFLAADKFTNTGNTNLTIIYTVVPISAGGCRGSAQSITITINPEPVTATNLNKTVCSDMAGGITLNTVPTSIAASNYNIISVSIQAGLTTVSAATIPATGVAANYLATDTYQNNGSTSLDVSYTVAPVSSLGCLGDPLVVKQTVNPEPVLGNLNKSVCSDLAINLTLATNGTSVAASTYNITLRSIAAGLTPAGGNATVPTSGVAATFLFNDKFTNNATGTLNVNYTVVPVSATGCLGDPVIVTIAIDPEPVLSPTLNKTVCSNVTSGLTLTTIGTAVAAASYNISAITVPGGLTTVVSAPIANNVSSTYLQNDKFKNTGASSLDVQYTIVPVAASGCLGDPVIVLLTIQPEPVIDPALALKTICSRAVTGITLNTNGVSVAALNYDITLVSQDVGLTGTPTVGNNKAANTILNDSYINVSSVPLKVVYQVVPRSAALCVGSAFTITVTVNPEPVINPALNNTVCSDDVSNIILSTNGTSAGAASYELGSLTVPGTVTPNAGNAAIATTGGINLIRNDKFTNVTASPAVVIYGIRGTSNSNCVGQVQSINLTINPKPVLDPALNPTPVCSGVISNVTLGVAPGSVAAITYNINAIAFAGLTAGSGNSGIGSGKPANTIINDVYVNTTNSPLQVVYKIVPVSAAGCLGTEATVTLTINPSPALLTGLDKTVCSEDISGITFGTKSTSVAAANYNIINVVIQAGLAQIAGNVGARSGVGVNEILNDKFRNSTNGTRIVTYTIEPVSAASCKGPQVDIVLTVEPAITMITPPPATICSDTPNTPSATNILLNSNTIPSAGAITFDYTAVSSPSGAVTGFFPAQSNLPKLTIIKDNLVNGTNSVATVTYTITPKAVGAKGGSGCQGFIATTVVITVEPKPRLSITPATQIVCEGVATTMTLSSSTVPSSGTIQFTKISAVPSGGMTLSSAPKTTYLNGEQIGDIWDNPTLLAQTVTYTFRSQIVGGSGCVSEDIIAVLTVNPAPTITASAQPAICSSDFVNITLTPDVANTIATYTKSAPSVISGASNGTGNLIFQTLFYNSLTPTVVNSDAAVTVNYTVTPKANGCTGPSIVVPVIVHPKPKILNVASTQKICHGNTLTIPLTSNVIGTNYTWTVDNPSGLSGIADQTVPVSTGVNQAITNTTGVQASLTYTIKAFGPGVNPNDCEGDQKIVIVTVAPQMSASFQNSPSSICKGTSEFLIIQLDGQAPFSFVYNQNDGTTSTDITVNGAGNFKVIQVKPTATTTYTIKAITDAFNCPFTVTGQSVTITVGDTDPVFSVVGATKACSPHQFLFQYNQKAGTQYTWQWQDGSADSTYVATTNVTSKTVPHTFTNVNPNKDQDYNVTMRVELPAPFPGCFKFSAKKVTINSIIVTNVIPDKTDICSGETIRFGNQSLGVTSHRWFWRNKGTTAVNEVLTSPSVSYVLSNTGILNPQPIEIVYQANNGNCPAPDLVTTVNVYKGVTADFSISPTNPIFNSGSSTITFTNNSVPFNISQFRYNWIFGITGDASPTTLTQTTTGNISVTYSSPGSKEITLSVTNIAAETAGLSCRADKTKSTLIVLPPLAASFDIDPKEFCFPGLIKLKNVVGTGFIHEWRVLNKKTGTTFTSNVANPGEFKITEAGEYTVSYKTSIPATGQVANAPLVDVKIYDLPLASFDLRPDIVFIPDQEMLTFNFTSGATHYRWNFGDTKDESDKFEPSYKYPVEGKYDVTLIAENDHGGGVICRDTLIRKIIAKQGGQAKIPNAFTPNTSGPSSNGQGGGGTFNDVFLPIVRGVPNDSDAYNLQIYDRWGNLIFESRSSTSGWDGYNKDGKLMPSGVYVYRLTIRFSDSQRTTQVGDVTMIY